jgi:RND family efflux transporter MFP subunit
VDTRTKLEKEARAGVDTPRSGKRSLARWGAGAGIVVAAVGLGWSVLSHGADAPAAHAPALPQVTVSAPLVRQLDTRLGFLGQFSAVDQVELRAQVGGTLTGIHFKDGAIVHKGDLLFTIDSVPYDIKLAQAKAQLETAAARLVLANHELIRAQALKQSEAGTAENVEQRTSEQRSAQASVDDAKAQVRDAQFDVDHCRLRAPFTGRMGTHLVSVGNLVAGSRAATSPTTLLATLVSLDPIYLDFDMSESDFQTYQRYQMQPAQQAQPAPSSSSQAPRGAAGAAGSAGPAASLNPGNKVEVALNGETTYDHEGVLDFINNVLDRSSGTIKARATVPNPGMQLTAGAFARVRVVVSPPTATLLIPDAAILPDQSRHLVLTVSADGTVVPKPVVTGDIRGGLRVIRSGLTSSDRVIIGGLPFAAPGSKVAAQDGVIHYAAGQD